MCSNHKRKPFIITIDTEGDNLWQWDMKSPIKTENSNYIKRFQQLCNKFGFKPTYLTNYEMANSPTFQDFAKETLKYNGCEIGMHLHSWNSPPIFELQKRNDGITAGKPYVTEYPEFVIEEKVKQLTCLLKNNFGIAPVSHRSGRWATNDVYAKILQKYGYKYDCSFMSRKNWESNPGFTNHSKGTNYSKVTNKLSNFFSTTIIEIPFQAYKDNEIYLVNKLKIMSWAKFFLKLVSRKKYVYLRPNGKNIREMFYIVKKNYKSRDKYLMFMLHSSELMPGGSPTFNSIDKIEKLYSDLELLFSEISKNYEGMTLSEFGDNLQNYS